MKLSTSSNSQKAHFSHNRTFFYYITDRRQFTEISLDSCIRRALKWGVDFVQIREKDLDDRALFELTRRVVDLAHGYKSRILVNGRADIALAAGADGVHLPSDSFRVSEIRPWFPKKYLIGVSVHTESEVRRACGDGADYLILGHIFPTPSKSGYGNPLGLEYLRKVCVGASIPVFGLGGIQADRIESVVESGAIGVAGISLFQENKLFMNLKKRYKTRPRKLRIDV
ncbi:MAG: thiamine phosphate synthase [Acidobacteriota bacterium]|jgi:thiamine-phosphate pyrophosphorylase